MARAITPKWQDASHPLLWILLLFCFLESPAKAQANTTDIKPAQSDSYTRTPGTNRLASIATPAVTRSLIYDNRGNLSSETRTGGITATTGYDGHGRLISYSRTGEDSFANGYNGLGDRTSMARTPAIGAAADIRRFVTAPDGRVLGITITGAIPLNCSTLLNHSLYALLQ